MDPVPILTSKLTKLFGIKKVKVLAWFKNDHKKVTLVLDLLIDSVYD